MHALKVYFLRSTFVLQKKVNKKVLWESRFAGKSDMSIYKDFLKDYDQKVYPEPDPLWGTQALEKIVSKDVITFTK